jgi:hypothetical protein
MRALRIHAGPRARQHLREFGLQAADVGVIPAAAGGPKGLALIALDRFLFAQWLPRSTQTVHLIGASIGAWRMAAACRLDPDAALAELADDYTMQSYPHAPGRQPLARDISRIFGANLQARLGTHAAEILSHPRFRLHVVTSRGRGILSREGRAMTPIGYAGAFAANVASRRAMGAMLERVVFSDARTPLPVPLDDYPTARVALSPENLAPSVLASCSIPFWLEAVQDIPGAPPGAYWDGGITDYHLHLDYRRMMPPRESAAGEELRVETDTSKSSAVGMRGGLVLYPHFQATLVPGWLDKALKRRHRATPRLDPVVVLAPDPDWIAAVMPNAKLPDRSDFKRYGEHRVAERQRDWRRAIAEGQRLADEFADLVDRPSIDADPLP